MSVKRWLRRRIHRAIHVTFPHQGCYRMLTGGHVKWCKTWRREIEDALRDGTFTDDPTFKAWREAGPPLVRGNLRPLIHNYVMDEVDVEADEQVSFPVEYRVIRSASWPARPSVANGFVVAQMVRGTLGPITESPGLRRGIQVRRPCRDS